MNTAIGLAAFCILVPYLDRLRQLDWRTHRWPVVGMHLAWAVWLGYVAFVALMEDGLHGLHAPIGVIGCLVAGLWIWISHSTWRKGPPEHTHTQPASLIPKGTP